MDSSSRTEATASEATQTGHLSSSSRRRRWWATEGVAQLVRLFRPQRQGANGAEGAQKPPRVTVSDLVRSTEAVLQFEARHGCIGQVEAMFDDIRTLLRDDEILHSPTTLEETEQLWINLLRLGMLDELLA